MVLSKRTKLVLLVWPVLILVRVFTTKIWLIQISGVDGFEKSSADFGNYPYSSDTILLVCSHLCVLVAQTKLALASRHRSDKFLSHMG